MIAYGILLTVILSKEFIEGVLGKRVYLFICCLAFICVYGFSSETMGLNDREWVYYRVFELCSGVNSLKEVIQLANSRISSGIMFYVITWIVSRFTEDYNIYLLLLGIPFNVAVTYYIGKYSKDKRLSYLIYLALIYPVSFTIVRQTVAMSVLMIAIEALHVGKWKKSIIFVLLASTIHLTSVVFLIAVALSRIKYNRFALLAVPAGLLIGATGGSWVLKIFIIILSDEAYMARYSESNGKGMALMAIAIRIAILIFLYMSNKTNYSWTSKGSRNNIGYAQSGYETKGRASNTGSLQVKAQNESEKTMTVTNDWFLWISTLSAVCACLMNVLGEFQRIAVYFDLFSLVSISGALVSIKKNDRVIIYIMLSILFVVYFLFFQLDNWNINEYTVFWKQM